MMLAYVSRADEYIARGVRWVYRGEGANITTTLSQDLEPEYVTINGDESRAFITLEVSITPQTPAQGVRVGPGGVHPPPTLLKT